MPGLLAIAIAYVLGAIPFGYLLVKFTQQTDVRESGSGNIGATNVLRTSGPAAARRRSAVVLSRSGGHAPYLGRFYSGRGHVSLRGLDRSSSRVSDHHGSVYRWSVRRLSAQIQLAALARRHRKLFLLGRQMSAQQSVVR